MSDLSKLRPEVREALDKLRACVLRCDPSLDPRVATIRADLLRLADESRALAVKLDESNADRAKAWANESAWKLRAEAAERERGELRAMLDDPGTTHADGCWTWGRRHYMCARNRIEALTAERDALRTKLAEVDQDRAKALWNESIWRGRAEAAERERDEWRRKVEEARVDWQPIDELHGAPYLVLAYVPPDARFPSGRMMIWNRDILARNIMGPTPEHLKFPVTHWTPLPEPPEE